MELFDLAGAVGVERLGFVHKVVKRCVIHCFKRLREIADQFVVKRGLGTDEFVAAGSFRGLVDPLLHQCAADAGEITTADSFVIGECVAEFGFPEGAGCLISEVAPAPIPDAAASPLDRVDVIEEMAMQTLAMTLRVNPQADFAYVGVLGIKRSGCLSDAHHVWPVKETEVLENECRHAGPKFVDGKVAAYGRIGAKATRIDHSPQPSEFHGVGWGDGVLMK